MHTGHRTEILWINDCCSTSDPRLQGTGYLRVSYSGSRAPLCPLLPQRRLENGSGFVTGVLTPAASLPSQDDLRSLNMKSTSFCVPQDGESQRIATWGPLHTLPPQSGLTVADAAA